MESKKQQLYIQSDWYQILGEANRDIWLLSKQPSQKGLYGFLTNKNNRLEASNGFSVDYVNISKKLICLKHLQTENKCVFVAPINTYPNIHKKSINCVDISKGGLGVSICSDNCLKIWNSSTGLIRRNLVGHVADIYTCRFFPSGIVVLTGGADMLLKIWSAETGQCPVTLTGHTGSVVDTCIVDRGRNVISVSKDGSAKLWDCGQSTCITNIVEYQNYINTCDIQRSERISDISSAALSDREISTRDKLLALGTENNQVVGVGLASRGQVFKYENDSPINCCCFLSENELFCGDQNGRLKLLDVRNPVTSVMSLEMSESPVLCLIPYKICGHIGVISGRRDGTCLFNSVLGGTTVSLTGTDCDPIYKVSCDEEYIYTASRDSVIRKYDLSSDLHI